MKTINLIDDSLANIKPKENEPKQINFLLVLLLLIAIYFLYKLLNEKQNETD